MFSKMTPINKIGSGSNQAPGQKQTSNPFSTGAGGTNFERKVQTYFAVRYLTGGFIPFMQSSKPKLIRFQDRVRGHQTDDITIVFENGSKLLCQVKHKIVFTEKNGDFINCITQAWIDFKEESFNRRTDRIAFITSIVPQCVVDHLLPLFTIASEQGTEIDLMSVVNTATEKRQYVEVIRTILKESSGVELDDARLWEFVKVLGILSFDMDNNQSKDYVEALDKLRLNLKINTDENCKSVWGWIYRIVSDMNQVAGSFSRENVDSTLLSVFKPPTERTPFRWKICQFGGQFTGNEQVLQEIVQRFDLNINSVVVTLVGIQGVGKSYLASKCVQTLNPAAYAGVAWFDATSEEVLQQSQLSFANARGIQVGKEGDVASAIKQWLDEQDQPSFLVFDNAKSYSTVKTHLPMRAHVLITSHNEVGWGNAIHVHPMSNEDAIQLLMGEAGLSILNDTERSKARELVQRLSALPLAIAQAGAYIQATSISIGEYLLAYETEKKALLEDGPLWETREEHQGVSVTFSLSFDRIKEKSPSAARMLRLFAFMHSQNIPRSLFKGIAVASDALCTHEEIRVLKGYSLVHANDRFISIHCVVQDVIREFKSTFEDQKEALRLLDGAYRYQRDDPVALEQAGDLIPHLDRACTLTAKNTNNTGLTNYLDSVNYNLGVYYLDAAYDVPRALFHFQEAAKYGCDNQNLKRMTLKAITKNDGFNAQAQKLAGQLIEELKKNGEGDVEVFCTIGNHYLGRRLYYKIDSKGDGIERAEPFLQKALWYARNNHKKEAMVLHYLGVFYEEKAKRSCHLAKAAYAKDGASRKFYDTQVKERDEWKHEAIRRYMKSLELKKKINEPADIIAVTHYRLAKLYVEYNELSKAEEHAKLAFEYYNDFFFGMNRKEIAQVNELLGDIAKKKGSPDRAVEHHQNSQKLFDECEDKKGGMRQIKKMKQIREEQSMGIEKYFSKKA